jgi:hypothetical protein
MFYYPVSCINTLMKLSHALSCKCQHWCQTLYEEHCLGMCYSPSGFPTSSSLLLFTIHALIPRMLYGYGLIWKPRKRGEIMVEFHEILTYCVSVGSLAVVCVVLVLLALKWASSWQKVQCVGLGDACCC